MSCALLFPCLFSLFSGKSSAWKILRKALEAVDGKKISTYVIDPKSLTKDELYGFLDSTTMEWTDGVFTSTIRNILDNHRGEQSRNHWASATQTLERQGETTRGGSDACTSQ